jgi:hypothetical protein
MASMHRDHRTDLEFLQGLTEAEFSELVFIPLLSAMGYLGIRYNHGSRELGKDIMFAKLDPIDGLIYMSASIKMHPLSGAVTSKRALREVFYQVSQSLQEPFLNPQTGEAIEISQAYLVSPFAITTEAISSVRGELRSFAGRLSALDGPILLDLISHHLPELLTSIETPERRFIQSLLLRLNTSRTSHPLAPHKHSTLFDVYTAGHLCPVSRETASLGSFAAPMELNSSCDIEEAVKKNHLIVVAADVGAGKTSLLQMLAARLLKRAHDLPETQIPLFIPLHRLPRSAFNPNGIAPAITTYLKEDGLEVPDWGAGTRFVLLLDGFDEISHRGLDEGKIFDSLAAIFQSIVITSRPSRLPNVSTRYAYYYLRPFEHTDISAFLGKWFAGRRELSIPLAEHIRTDPILRIFCRTPLMLTLVAILAERFPLAQLPSRRTAIYSEIADLLLGRWDEIREVESSYSADLKSYVLEQLALVAHRSYARRFNIIQLNEGIKSALESAAARGADQYPGVLAREILYRTSLLRANSDSQIEFSHMSFQEYFAARKLSHEMSGHPYEYLYDEWWRGVCAFLYGIRRSMDGLALARNRKHRSAEALGTYLAEADYTSPDQRSGVLLVIGNELLNRPRLDEASTRFYSAYGYELVALMDREVMNSDNKVNGFNYVLLALTCDDERAILNLLDKKDKIIPRLSAEGAFATLEVLAKRIASPPALFLLEYILRRWPHPPQRTGNARLEFCRKLAAISEDIQTTKGAPTAPLEFVLRAQEALFDAAKVVSLSRPLPPFDAGSLSHWSILAPSKPPRGCM